MKKDNIKNLHIMQQNTNDTINVELEVLFNITEAVKTLGLKSLGDQLTRINKNITSARKQMTDVITSIVIDETHTIN